MGLMTLQNYRDALGAGAAAGELQRTSIGNTLVDKWVNQAMREFGYAFRFHDLEATFNFNTVIGTETYQIGAGQAVNISDFRYIDALRGINPDTGSRYNLFPETRTKDKRLSGDPTDSTTWGLPQWYNKFGLKIYLRPIPSAIMVLGLDYGKSITPLLAGTDVSPFHEDWDEVIEMGALYRGFRHFGEFDRYQNVRNDFLGLVRSRSTEFDLEEFPEGGISPLGPNDTDTDQESLG